MEKKLEDYLSKLRAIVFKNTEEIVNIHDRDIELITMIEELEKRVETLESCTERIKGERHD